MSSDNNRIFQLWASMRRRRLLAGLVAAVVSAVGYRRASQAADLVMPDAAPEKIRLIPDVWNISNVGRMSDGRLFFVDSQLDSTAGITTDFVCTFLFDQDGHLVDHVIELIGARGTYLDGRVGNALARHLTALAGRTRTDIWVRPFSVESHGTTFGLIPRETESGEWRVEFMPGIRCHSTLRGRPASTTPKLVRSPEPLIP